MKMKYLRWASLLAVFAIVSVGLILNTNLGTLSSFGWQAVAAICPLGAIESMLASRSIFLQAAFVLAVIVVLVMVFGKFFCSWICPIAPISAAREFIRKKIHGEGKSKSENALTPSVNSSYNSNTSLAHTSHCHSREGGNPLSQQVLTMDSRLRGNDSTSSVNVNTSCSSCAASCPSKRSKLDSRHIILGGSLLSAAIFGFPVFCLLCPIGLLFGTIIVAWQFFGVEDFSLSLLIYPLLLVLELVVFRKWCGKICPMGALLSLISLGNRFFKPVVDRKKCIRANGGDCNICSTVCKEELDPHYAAAQNECSKCGTCKDNCPSGAISFVFMPKKDDYIPNMVIAGEKKDLSA